MWTLSNTIVNVRPARSTGLALVATRGGAGGAASAAVRAPGDDTASKLTIACGCFSSVTVKSSWRRPVTGFPFLSATTTSTTTRSVRSGKTGAGGGGAGAASAGSRASTRVTACGRMGEGSALARTPMIASPPEGDEPARAGRFGRDAAPARRRRGRAAHAHVDGAVDLRPRGAALRLRRLPFPARVRPPGAAGHVRGARQRRQPLPALRQRRARGLGPRARRPQPLAVRDGGPRAVSQGRP